MTRSEQFIAAALLTQRELDAIGHQLQMIYRLDDNSEFDALLAAIDQADAANAKPIITNPDQ